jgi:hypothetical protein
LRGLEETRFERSGVNVQCEVWELHRMCVWRSTGSGGYFLELSSESRGQIPVMKTDTCLKPRSGGVAKKRSATAVFNGESTHVL